MPIQLQLALQGGGAKMYALIAALDAIDGFVKKEEIVITRVAGTSAGAIVGALYAAGVAPALMRAEFQKTELLPRVPNLVWSAICALRGKPIVNDKQLRSLVERLLRYQRPSDSRAPSLSPVLMKELPKPCFIIASDICNRTEVTYDNQSAERVVDCVMRSSGIPFFFVSHAGQEIIVDGGLCNNLPANVLADGIKKYGEIIAVSFSDYARKTPTNAISFAMTLLDTAIDAGVARAKNGSDVFVIELDPYSVGTFDFSDGQRNLDPDSAPYREAKARTDKVLREIVKPGRVIGGGLWTNADPSIMEDLWEVYKSQEAPRRFRYLRRRLSAIAHSLIDSTAEDSLVQEIEFATGKFDMNSVVAQIVVKKGGSPGNVLCEVTDTSGQAVSFRPVPLKLSSGEGVDTYGLLVCFTPPLPAGGPMVYRLTVEYSLRHAFPGLNETERKDELVSMAGLRADGPVPLMELILYVPKVLSQHLVLSPRAGSLGSILSKENDGARSPGHTAFEYHRWVARNVDPSEKIGVSLELH